MSSTLPLTLVITEILLWFILAGSVTFIATYRPFSWRRHAPEGAHMLRMTYSLGGFAALSILYRHMPFDEEIYRWLQLVFLAGVTYAVWERVWLRRQSRRRHLQRRLTVNN